MFKFRAVLRPCLFKANGKAEIKNNTYNILSSTTEFCIFLYKIYLRNTQSSGYLYKICANKMIFFLL